MLGVGILFYAWVGKVFSGLDMVIVCSSLQYSCIALSSYIPGIILCSKLFNNPTLLQILLLDHLLCW